MPTDITFDLGPVWWTDEHEALFRRLLPPERVSDPKPFFGIEIGSFLGRSTSRLLTIYPNLRLFCVDPWTGAAEISQNPELHRYLDRLEQRFTTNMEHLGLHRRITKITAQSFRGFQIIKENWPFDQPMFIYIDGAHDENSVAIDFILAKTMFPGAIIVGDDWNAFPSVRSGVSLACRMLGTTVRTSPSMTCWYNAPEDI